MDESWVHFGLNEVPPPGTVQGHPHDWGCWHCKSVLKLQTAGVRVGEEMMPHPGFLSNPSQDIFPFSLKRTSPPQFQQKEKNLQGCILVNAK